MIPIKKIISGGQTGVDRGALEAAFEQALDMGGWCSPGREAEDGRIPDEFPLNETPNERSTHAPAIPRSLRTEWNVRDSDATLILLPYPEQKPDPGTEWTKTCCIKMNKPFLICDPFDANTVSEISKWLNKVKPGVLNIAGPSEKTAPGIQQTTKRILTEVLLLQIS
ncbi:putative molybdenum carrier protein [Prolixibacteraceae bacterium Z1-6]|uniref:Molybdenum carrier protein n=1 Tax=Draconibacterium aestuarii TaxID=2998507 RepID=A0A9X3FAL4_9BACT|nr:putative molybdenum carrier protein [Prolixibacteraceae bacterium Z1-6]